MQHSKIEYQDAAERALRWFIIKGKTPANVRVGNERIPWPTFQNIIKAMNVEVNTKGKLPETIEFGTTAPAAPPSNPNCHQTGRYTWMKQNMEYITCAPSALWETLWEFGTPPTPARLAKLCKTQYGFRGTNPADIIAAIPQIGREMGLNLTAEEEYFKDIGYQGMAAMLDDPNVTFIVHGYCSGWRRYYKTYSKGHFVSPVKICFDTNTIWVADSDRGVITYLLNEFEQGMKNCPCKSIIAIYKH